MNFSDRWRSLWPIDAIFPVLNLLSGDLTTAFGLLLFRSSLPYRLLLASPSLALNVIPPASPPLVFEGIHAIFSCSSNASVLPSAAQKSLTADVLSCLVPSNPLLCNNLHSLPLPVDSSLLLFFPTGDNTDEIEFLCIHFKGENLMLDVMVDHDGDVFKQKGGLKHSRHRIHKMSVVKAQIDYSLPTGNFITEGFLMATTMYSVN